MSFHVIYIQTQYFPIIVSRHINATYDEIENTWKRESVKKPYENEKVTKQYKGKGHKTMSISSSSSISVSLHSDYVVNARVAGKRKHKGGFVIPA